MVSRWIRFLAIFVGVCLLYTPVFASKSIEEGSAQLHSAALQVSVSADGSPLAFARVKVVPLGLVGTTNAVGIVRFEQIILKDSVFPVSVAVDALGYRSWVIEQPRLVANDTLQIDATLQPAVGSNQAPEVVSLPEARTAEQQPTPNPNMVAQPNAVQAYSFPSTIKVQRVSLGRIDTVDFKFYVKHVLPNEWIPSWNSNSLKAGAVAAKQFAWYNTSINRKYSSTAYDVKDTTADQVYTPNVSYASMDAAVDATWSTIVLKSGAPFQTQFCAGASNSSRTSGQCGELYGYSNFPAGYYMSQYGSQYLASNLGYSWQSILSFYYTNSTFGSVGSSTPSIPNWPVLRTGDNNSKVVALQYLLRHRGYTLSVDGAFGAGTESVVKSFQSSQGLVADGVVGANTFTKLIVTVRQGDNNNAVRAIQRLLGVTSDGVFGSGTYQSVRQLQQSYGLTVDGIVGPTTWQTAFGK